jgi:uncharacterized protein YciI
MLSEGDCARSIRTHLGDPVVERLCYRPALGTHGQDERSIAREKPMQERKTFIILSAAGPNRDLAKGTREQTYWDEHATFIDALVKDGFIVLGGPLVDEGGAILVVRAVDEAAVRDTMKDDPWYVNGILTLVSIKRWEIFIDRRA